MRRAGLLAICLLGLLLVAPASAGAYMNKWRYVADSQPVREQFSSTQLPDGRILIAGGFGLDSSVATSAQIYDPTTNAWSPAADMPIGTLLSSAVVLDGVVYVVGGVSAAPAPPLQTYDPVADAWGQRHALPKTVDFAGAAVTSNGRILYFVGGNPTSPGPRAGDVISYNPATDTWTTLATDMPVIRDDFEAVRAANGKIYVIGGCCNPRHLQWKRVDVYDPATNAWTQAADLPKPRIYAGARLGTDGLIYVVGGGDLDHAEDHTPGTRTVLSYDPASNTWVQRAAMHDPRYGLELARGGDGRLYAIGGAFDSGDDECCYARVDQYR